MKEETRKVVVLDWEDKIKLQQVIKELEQVADTYKSICKDVTIINNAIYYLKTIEEKINQRMKKQIVLDEQDIKEFHEDAEHLRWLYNRMVREYGESVNFDYMHRFAKIFNKLKQLQLMKIRLAKKIWARSIDRLSPYWSIKLLQCKIDNRIVQAAKRVTKWEANNLKNRLEKHVRITPSQAKEIRRSVELLNCSLSDCVNAAKQQLKRNKK